MNPKTDKLDLRVQRTRKLLFDALLLLIKEKGFESINVKNICDRALVHRTTFYKHYEDKYDLLYQGARTMFDQLSSTVNFPDITPESVSSGIVPTHLISLFHHAAEHKEFYQMMLNIYHNNIFNRMLKTYLVERSLYRLQYGTLNDKKPKIPHLIIARFSVGAVSDTLTWWLEKNMPYTPEEMANYMASLLGYGIFHAYGLTTENTKIRLKPDLNDH